MQKSTEIYRKQELKSTEQKIANICLRLVTFTHIGYKNITEVGEIKAVNRQIYVFQQVKYVLDSVHNPPIIDLFVQLLQVLLFCVRNGFN